MTALSLTRGFSAGNWQILLTNNRMRPAAWRAHGVYLLGQSRQPDFYPDQDTHGVATKEV